MSSIRGTVLEARVEEDLLDHVGKAVSFLGDEPSVPRHLVRLRDHPVPKVVAPVRMTAMGVLNSWLTEETNSSPSA
jgi:hypothetical protein